MAGMRNIKKKKLLLFPAELTVKHYVLHMIRNLILL